AGALSDPLERGLARLAAVRAGDHPGAPPPPLRGQQRLPAQAGEERAARLRALGREAARRDPRAARASLLRGQPVPPRVPLPPLGSPPALRRLRRRRPRTRRGEMTR